jgi:FkbM family methyltransferase
VSWKRGIIHSLKKIGAEESARAAYYRILGKSIVKRAEIGGDAAVFRCPTPTLADYIASTNREREVIESFLELIEPDYTVWDVGANIGLWTLFIATRLKGRGQVVAFEPFARARTLLEQNLILNHIENTTVYSSALGNENGEVPFYPSVDGAISTSALACHDGPYGTERKPLYVPIRTAGRVVDENTFLLPDAVKIDVEGAELAVLEGFSDSIWKRLKVLFVEVHPDLITALDGSVDAVRGILERHDFEIQRQYKRLDTYHWFCWKDG